MQGGAKVIAAVAHQGFRGKDTKATGLSLFIARSKWDKKAAIIVVFLALG
jgi:hypothetical protein